MFEIFKDQNDELLTERIPIIKQKRKNRIVKIQNREKKMSQNLKKNEEGEKSLILNIYNFTFGYYPFKTWSVTIFESCEMVFEV